MLVFQYGSNMYEERINSDNRLNGDAKFIGVAKTIENYEIDFTVWSVTNKCYAADMVNKGKDPVWGVLYEIPEELVYREKAKKIGRKSLDAIEGEGINYKRINVKLEIENGEHVTSITYVVINPQKGKTSPEYAKHIMKGLEKHKDKIPLEYIKKVKKIIEDSINQI